MKLKRQPVERPFLRAKEVLHQETTKSSLELAGIDEATKEKLLNFFDTWQERELSDINYLAIYAAYLLVLFPDQEQRIKAALPVEQILAVLRTPLNSSEWLNVVRYFEILYPDQFTAQKPTLLRGVENLYTAALVGGRALLSNELENLLRKLKGELHPVIDPNKYLDSKSQDAAREKWDTFLSGGLETSPELLLGLQEITQGNLTELSVHLKTMKAKIRPRSLHTINFVMQAANLCLFRAGERNLRQIKHRSALPEREMA